jgi:hypothetical protein
MYDKIACIDVLCFPFTHKSSTAKSLASYLCARTPGRILQVPNVYVSTVTVVTNAIYVGHACTLRTVHIVQVQDVSGLYNVDGLESRCDAMMSFNVIYS